LFRNTKPLAGKGETDSHLAAGRAIDKSCMQDFEFAARSVRERKNLTDTICSNGFANALTKTAGSRKKALTSA